MIGRAENMLITLSFSTACREGDCSHSFRFAQFDCNCGGFIVPLPTGISANLDIICQHNVFRKAAFDLVLSILALCRLLEVDSARYDDL